jgi:hypothetical protein
LYLKFTPDTSKYETPIFCKSLASNNGSAETQFSKGAEITLMLQLQSITTAAASLI